MDNAEEAKEEIIWKEKSSRKTKKKEFKMTEEEKALNRKILKNMQIKSNFVRNPRFKHNSKHMLFSNPLFKDIKSPENPFVVEPPIVIFRNYQLNSVYRIILKLTNKTHLLTNFKHIPPKTENFTIDLPIQYPKKDSSLIAPGMSVKIPILFNASTLDNFEDDIEIFTESFGFKVALKGIRDLPALSLENPMNCNKCLIGESVKMVFRCKNNGGDAHFKFLTNSDNMLLQSNSSANNLLNSSQNQELETLNVFPFFIFPIEFYLHKGMETDISVQFFPSQEGIVEKDLTLCCDSKINLNYKLSGEGILIDMKILSIDNIDLSEIIETLFFDDTFPYSQNQKKIKIENNTSVFVKYHFSIYENSEKNIGLKDSESIFSIEPSEGSFSPNQIIEFDLKFLPKASKIYEYKLELIVEDIPFQSIKNSNQSSYIIEDKYHLSEPFMFGMNSPYPSYPIISLNLNGKGKLSILNIDPIFIHLGDVYINSTVNRHFQISSKNKGKVIFKLKKIYQILLNANRTQINNYFKGFQIFENSKFGENYQKEEVNFLKLHSNFSLKSTSKAKESRQTQNQSLLNRSKTKKARSSLSIQQSTLQDDKPHDYEVNEDNEFVANDDNLVEFTLFFNPNKLGRFKGVILFDNTEGVPVSLEILGNVIGGSVDFSLPSLDFGLMSVLEVKTIDFKITNKTNIPVKLLLKESEALQLNFENYEKFEYLQECQGFIDEKLTKFEIKTLQDYDNKDNENLIIDNDIKYILKFSKALINLDPNQEINVTVSLASPCMKLLDSQIEVMIENSESQYINIYANIQEAYAYLSYLSIKPKNIYITTPVSYENNMVEIINPSNLDVNFNWQQINDPDELTAEFTPAKGTIPAKSSIRINYRIVYYRSGYVNNMFLCNIKEMDIPLGMVIEGKVTGLDIAYELTDDSLYYLMDKYETNSMSSVTSSVVSNAERKLKSKSSLKSNIIDRTFSFLEFKHLKVNKHQTVSFVIKNYSGISTTFNLYCVNFKCGEEKTLRNDMKHSVGESDGHSRSVKESSFSKGLAKVTKGKKENRVSGTLLSDFHEALNFSSAKGLEFSKIKQIEKESVLYLMNKKGVAIVISPNSGHLDKNSEVVISVSIYNDCVGDFEDELVCEIKGLSERRFPINIRIRGNPLQLSPFQPGIDYALNPPSLKMGNVLTKSNHLEKTFKLLNTGSNTMNVFWKIYDYKNIMEPKTDVFKIRIAEKGTVNKKSFKLEYEALNPPEIEEDQQFDIKPTEAEIPPKGTKDFRLRFLTNYEGNHSCLIVAYPKITNNTINTMKLTELALKIEAKGISPHITVDKSANKDGRHEYKFISHSFGSSPRLKRSIVLINEEKINLIIKLSIEGPFKIINAEPKLCLVSESIFNVMPSSNLKLDIKFIPPNSNDEKNWPMTLVNEKHGKLTVLFENGEFQEFWLKGILKRPRLLLSTTGTELSEGPNFIDFGKVNVESERKSFIWISNETEVETKCIISHFNFQNKKVYGYKTITNSEQEDLDKVDDPSVFVFESMEKIIYGPSNQLSLYPLGPAVGKIENPLGDRFNPWKITICFKPKKNIFYKSRYKIYSETGNCLELMLKGYGSYLEEYI